MLQITIALLDYISLWLQSQVVIAVLMVDCLWIHYLDLRMLQNNKTTMR